MGEIFPIKLFVPNNFGPKLATSQKIFVQKTTVIKRICLRKFRWGKTLRKLLDQDDVSQKKIGKNNLMKKKNLMKNFCEENGVKKILIKKSWFKKMLVQ